MKKFLEILSPLLLLAYMLFSLSFAAEKNSELLCNDLQIVMKDTLHSGFLNRTDIEKIIFSEEKELLGYPISKINTRKLEKLIREQPYIKDAEIFYDLEGVLYVKVMQRIPIIKILTKTGRSYYLDEEGYIFKPKAAFTPHILIANGYFTEDEKIKTAKNIYFLGDDAKYAEWHELHRVAHFIENNKFWNSQIVQIYFNRKGEFELIPRVGAHQIILGNADNIELKFRNLRILYDKGLAYEGWNKYEKINLKYNNQVICTKR